MVRYFSRIVHRNSRSKEQFSRNAVKKTEMAQRGRNLVPGSTADQVDGQPLSSENALTMTANAE